MAYKLQQMWMRVSGIPSAPLIGEQLTAIDFDFMKTKAALTKEHPFMSMLELMEETEKKLPEDCIIGQLMIAGFQHAATEIRELIREDAARRTRKKRGSTTSTIIPVIPLGKDMKKLSMLSEVLCELEQFGGQWKKIIIARLELAEALQKCADSWLSSRILNSCFRFLSHLDESIPEDRVIIAELYLTKAFFGLIAFELNQNQLHHFLQKCFQMLGDHKDKKMYSVMSHKGTPKRDGIISIDIELPIALHGWHNYGAAAKLHDILTLRNTSLYRMGCVIASLSLLKDVKRHGSGHSTSPTTVSERNDILESNQRSFTDAITFAIEGENSSCVFHAIYVCGAYLKGHALYSEASKVFDQLKSKSQLLNEFETLGIAHNRLGIISKRKHKIQEAMEHFGEEWGIGHDCQLPILLIDALMDLGNLLLEEGQVVEAEILSCKAYDELEVITQSGKISEEIKTEESDTKYDFKQDDIYEKTWVMAGVAAGQRNFSRLAGQCRSRKLHPITDWQTSRTPLPAVCHNTAKRPIRIVSCKKHYDITYLTQKMKKTMSDLSLDGERDELEDGTAHWLEKIDHESFELIQDRGEQKRQQNVLASNETEKDVLHRLTYTEISAALLEIYVRQRSQAAEEFETENARPRPRTKSLWYVPVEDSSSSTELSGDKDMSVSKKTVTESLLQKMKSIKIPHYGEPKDDEEDERTGSDEQTVSEEISRSDDQVDGESHEEDIPETVRDGESKERHTGSEDNEQEGPNTYDFHTKEEISNEEGELSSDLSGASNKVGISNEDDIVLEVGEKYVGTNDQ